MARHARSYGRDQQVLDPLHYLATLEHHGRRRWTTHRCSRQLPEAFTHLRQALETRHGPTAGPRHFVRVLQLVPEHSLERVQAAITACLRRDEVHAERIAPRPGV